MDVVFNHTAEGNENGLTLSFKGIENSVFYMLAPKVHPYLLFNFYNILVIIHYFIEHAFYGGFGLVLVVFHLISVNNWK